MNKYRLLRCLALVSAMVTPPLPAYTINGSQSCLRTVPAPAPTRKSTPSTLSTDCLWEEYAAGGCSVYDLPMGSRAVYEDANVARSDDLQPRHVPSPSLVFDPGDQPSPTQVLSLAFADGGGEKGDAGEATTHPKPSRSVATVPVCEHDSLKVLTEGVGTHVNWAEAVEDEGLAGVAGDSASWKSSTAERPELSKVHVWLRNIMVHTGAVTRNMTNGKLEEEIGTHVSDEVSELMDGMGGMEATSHGAAGQLTGPNVAPRQEQ